MIRLVVLLTLFAAHTTVHAAEQYRLTHRTTYTYDREVSLSEQTIRLIPARSAEPAIRQFSFTVLPAKASATIEPLPDGNFAGRVHLGQKTSLFSYTVSFVFTPKANNQKPDAIAPRDPELLRFIDGPLLKNFVASIKGDRSDFRETAVAACRTVHSTVEYSVREEQGLWAPEETLSKRTGSCRDMVVLLMHSLRSIGIHTRYVSGYLVFPGKAGECGLDFHAWCEAYIPNAGWVALDPTVGEEAGLYHIPLFRDPIPEKAAGLSGAVDECRVTLNFDMRAEPLEVLAEIKTSSPATSVNSVNPSK